MKFHVLSLSLSILHHEDSESEVKSEDFLKIENRERRPKLWKVRRHQSEKMIREHHASFGDHGDWFCV